MVSKKSKETLHRIDGEKTEYLGGKLSFWSLIYLWFRSTTMIQGSFNYAYYQGTGYSQILFPFFKRIYSGNKAKLKEALSDNIEFFNSGPYCGVQAITALHVLLLQSGQTNADVKKLKFALMGPLAGINDSLFNFGMQPLLAGIAAALSANGEMSGFWFYMIVYNAIQFGAAIVLTVVTYRSGQKFMSNISSVMAAVVKMASMVGITIIGALAVHYTGIKLALETTSIVNEHGAMAVKVTSYQAILDQFMPYFLQVVLVSTMYLMMSKYGWSIYKTLVFIIMLGIVGYAFGIFA